MDYSNVLTDLTWIFVIVATILILIEFRGIIEDFQVKGHIQGRSQSKNVRYTSIQQNFVKKSLSEYRKTDHHRAI
jgi:hypothetical protein